MSYAIIHRYTGHLVGVNEAPTILDACEAMDMAVDDQHYAYRTTYSEGDWIYCVYHVPPGRFQGADGRDPAVIGQVRSCPLVGFVGREPLDIRQQDQVIQTDPVRQS